MYKKKLCLGLSSEFGLSFEDLIPALRQTGFEAFFTGWDQNIGTYKKNSG